MLSEIHIYMGTGLLIICYFFYFKACTVSPGTVTVENHAITMQRFEHSCYFPKHKFNGELNNCKTCKLERPARSKHCSMCNCCVEKHDHHCIWINQCVGLKNYKWFLGFIFLMAWICTYGVLIGVAICLYIVKFEEKLFEKTFILPDGTHKAANWYLCLWFLWENECSFILCLIMMLVTGILLHVFFL